MLPIYTIYHSSIGGQGRSLSLRWGRRPIYITDYITDETSGVVRDEQGAVDGCRSSIIDVDYVKGVYNSRYFDCGDMGFKKRQDI